MSRTATTVKKPLPENLLAWLLEYRNNPDAQLALMTPPGLDIDQAAKDGAVLVRKDREDAPAWLGYPFARVERSAFAWVPGDQQHTSKPIYKKELVTLIEPKALTFNTKKGPLNLRLVAVDFQTKCGVYLNADVYDIPEISNYLEIAPSAVVDTGDYE